MVDLFGADSLRWGWPFSKSGGHPTQTRYSVKERAAPEWLMLGTKGVDEHMRSGIHYQRFPNSGEGVREHPFFIVSIHTKIFPGSMFSCCRLKNKKLTIVGQESRVPYNEERSVSYCGVKTVHVFLCSLVSFHYLSICLFGVCVSCCWAHL